jgi:phospholipid/cholesterol/gamma-HCH transport system substrate-binding protein
MESSATPSPRSRLPRIVAILALVVGFALAVVALLGGDSGHQYKLLFETGGQLVPDNEVLVAGQRVGKVDSIDLTDDGQAAVKITTDEPLHTGTTAEVRATSLSGIANRYVALTMGPNNAPTIPDGATLTTDKTTTPVDIDQLFDIFNPKARRSLQKVIKGQADVYAGAELQANKTYKYIAPGLQSTTRLLAELNSDQQAFEKFLSSGAKALGAVAERRDDLSSLTQNANTALGAIAQENDSLDRTLVALPPAMRQANTTFVNLRAALDDLDPLIATTGRSTKTLPGFLRKLRPVAHRGVGVFQDLADVVSRNGSNNDLADALKKLPKARDAAAANVPRVITSLDRTQDNVDFARPYTPDLMAFITKLGQVTSYYDADGHYTRVQPAGSNFFGYNPGTQQLESIPTSQQFAAYSAFGLGPFARCPGGATQPHAGSNPFVNPPIPGGVSASDCDPTAVPPGP